MITYSNQIDVKEYNEMRGAVGWKMLDLEQAQRGLDNSEYVIAAYDGDKAIGTARIIGDGGYMYLLADVMVLPEYQKSGIGRHMLTEINKWFEERAKDGSCIMINLMATSGNEGFYAKFGFTARPNDTMGAGMVKWLNS